MLISAFVVAAIAIPPVLAHYFAADVTIENEYVPDGR